jgi:hypothetical protein
MLETFPGHNYGHNLNCELPICVFHTLVMRSGCNGRGKPTASVLSADGFPLMAGPNFQSSDGNPTVISILRQLADGPKNVPEM